MGEAALVSDAPLIRLRGFGKRYRKEVAVDGVELAIHRGEIYGLIGPDGAGKSSLMKAVAGVLSFEAGEVEVFGVRLDSEAAAERIKGRIGFMPQGLGLNLYAELSVEENIDFFAQLREVPPKQLAGRKRRLLAMTRLTPFRDRPMKHLSGGMKQKLGLICTLIHEPELVILDEPTTGVDPVSRRDFWAILAELLRERGITALISTAYMDEAARFHRLSLMYQGRVLAAGEPDEIRQVVPGTLVTLQASPQIEALRRLRQHYPQVEAVGPQLRVFVEGMPPAQAGAAVRGRLEGLEVTAMTADEPELEDAFVALLRRRGLAGEATADDTVLVERRGGAGGGGGDAPRGTGHQGAHRLYVPGLLPLSGSDSAGEHPPLRPHLRSAAPAVEGTDPVGDRHGRAARGGAAAHRPPAHGDPPAAGAGVRAGPPAAGTVSG